MHFDKQFDQKVLDLQKERFSNHQYQIKSQNLDQILIYGSSNDHHALGNWFYVSVTPHIFTVYGDIGEIIFLSRFFRDVNMRKMYQWIKEQVIDQNYSYLSFQVPQPLRDAMIFSFDSNLAKQELIDMCEYLKKDGYFLDEFDIECLLDSVNDCDTKEVFYERFYESELNRLHDLHDHMPACEHVSYRFAYQMAALKDMFEKVDLNQSGYERYQALRERIKNEDRL